MSMTLIVPFEGTVVWKQPKHCLGFAVMILVTATSPVLSVRHALGRVGQGV